VERILANGAGVAWGYGEAGADGEKFSEKNVDATDSELRLRIEG
jgi:hypothetical protein